MFNFIKWLLALLLCFGVVSGVQAQLFDNCPLTGISPVDVQVQISGGNDQIKDMEASYKDLIDHRLKDLGIQQSQDAPRKLVFTVATETLVDGVAYTVGAYMSLYEPVKVDRLNDKECSISTWFDAQLLISLTNDVGNDGTRALNQVIDDFVAAYKRDNPAPNSPSTVTPHAIPSSQTGSQPAPTNNPAPAPIAPGNQVPKPTAP